MPDVPVPGDHGRVLLAEHGVEGGLTKQTWRPLAPARCFNEREFPGPVGRQSVTVSISVITLLMISCAGPC
jgi:hypothetical protein